MKSLQTLLYMIGGTAYGVFLFYWGARFSGAGHGTFFFMSIIAAPPSILLLNSHLVGITQDFADFVFWASIPLFWASVFTLSQSRRRSLRILFFVLISSHYIQALLMPVLGPAECGWYGVEQVVRSMEAPIIIWLFIYYAGQMLLWVNFMRYRSV
jgi:hypothetical protein